MGSLANQLVVFLGSPALLVVIGYVVAVRGRTNAPATDSGTVATDR